MNIACKRNAVFRDRQNVQQTIQLKLPFRTLSLRFDLYLTCCLNIDNLFHNDMDVMVLDYWCVLMLRLLKQKAS